MENKKVGWLIIGLAVVMMGIVLIFNSLLQKVIDQECTMGLECVMHGTANTQLGFGIAIVAIILIIGLYIMFSKPDERIIIKKIKDKRKKLDLSKLDSVEKRIIKTLLKEGRAMFQKDLIERLEIGKVKMTRLLDKLEAKQFLIRKRRGMNNFVVLKN